MSLGADGGSRTPNLGIKNPLLCQLSYVRVRSLGSWGKTRTCDPLINNQEHYRCATQE